MTKTILSVYYERGRLFVSFDKCGFLEAISAYVLLPIIFLFFIMFLPESMAFRVNVKRQANVFANSSSIFLYFHP